MPRPEPSAGLLRTLAGEGNFNLYRMLTNGNAGFLFLKCLRTVIFHTVRGGAGSNATTVVFLKGANQLRLYKRQKTALVREFGRIDICAMSGLQEPHHLLLPRFAARYVWLQILFLILMLMTGRKRYLDLFLLEFFGAIQRSLDIGLPELTTLVCYNDQPFEMAAIITAVHQRRCSRTIVIQHGLVLNEAFYFPTNAQEFWAWGELSRLHFRSRVPEGRLMVRGRYTEDAALKRDEFVLPKGGAETCNMLAGTSFMRHDLKQMATALRMILTQQKIAKTQVAIKLHPATKMAWLWRLWFCYMLPGVRIESGDMEDLANRYDLFLTKNSTSALDFLLLGKPVIFLEFPDRLSFPNKNYSFELFDMVGIFDDKNQYIQKNICRLDFIYKSLNIK